MCECVEKVSRYDRVLISYGRKKLYFRERERYFITQKGMISGK